MCVVWVPALAAVTSVMMSSPCSGFIGGGVVVLPKGPHVPCHPRGMWHGRGADFPSLPSAIAASATAGTQKASPTRMPMNLPAEPSDGIGDTGVSSQFTEEGGEGPASSSWSPLRRPGLALVDLVSLVAFAAVGKASHAVGDGSIVEEVVGVAKTAFPFVVSWFAASLVTGVYAPLLLPTDSGSDDDDGLGSSSSRGWLAATWKQTAKGWIVAVPLGCVLRGLLRGYPPPVPFVVVTMIATLVILGLARTAYNYFDVVVARKESP
jgi:hypothetical protein